MARIVTAPVALEPLVEEPGVTAEIFARRFLQYVEKDMQEHGQQSGLLVVVEHDPHSARVLLKGYYGFEPGERWTPSSVIAGALRRFARRSL